MPVDNPLPPRRVFDDHCLHIAAHLEALAHEFRILTDIAEPGRANDQALPLIAALEKLSGRGGGLRLEALLLAAQAVDNEHRRIDRSLNAYNRRSNHG